MKGILPQQIDGGCLVLCGVLMSRILTVLKYCELLMQRFDFMVTELIMLTQVLQKFPLKAPIPKFILSVRLQQILLFMVKHSIWDLYIPLKSTTVYLW